MTKNPDLSRGSSLSYILGVLKGDGSAFLHQKTGMIKLSQTDKDFASAFKKHLERIELNPNTVTYKREYSDGRVTEIFQTYASSKNFVKWYISLDLDSLIEKVKKNERYFVKGFYDSEGSLDIRDRENRNFPQTRIIICNSNKNLLEHIQEMLLNSLDISSNLVIWSKPNTSSGWNKKKIFALRIYKNTDVINFLKKVDSNIAKKSYSKLDSFTDEEPRKVLTHSSETYNKAIKLHNKELGSSRISDILDVPKGTVGGWIYKDRKPPSVKK